MRCNLSIFVAGLTALTLGVASGQPTPATRPATTPAATAPASQPTAAAASEQAANDLTTYISAHRDELEPALTQANFNPNGGAEDYRKLKALLPADMASKVDLAVPALNARRINTQISVNLKYIGTALASYTSAKQGTMPDGLGHLVALVPSVEVFLPPDAAIPLEVKQVSPEQQTPWINAHTMFAFPGAGKKVDSSEHTVIAYERLELDPQKPRIAVLFGDGHVDSVDRAALEKLLKLR